jgi:hypothetical protein
MNPITEYFKTHDTLPWRRSGDGEWTSLSTETWKSWNYGACEKLRASEHRLHWIYPACVLAFCAGFGVCWLAFVR